VEKVVKTSLARTASWLAAGHSLQTVVTLVLPLVLVRVLTQGDYGVFKQLDLAAALLAPFLVLGLDKSVTYFVPRRESNASAEIAAPIAALLVLAVMLIPAVILFPTVFGTLFAIPAMPLLAVAVAAYAVSASFQMIATRALIALDAPKTAAVLPFAVGFPRTVAVVVVALVTHSLPAIFTAIIVLSLLKVATYTIILYVVRPFKILQSVRLLGKHLRYGAPLALHSAVQSWGARIDRYLISGFYAAETFAVYSVGQTAIPFIPLLARAMGDATAPRFSKLESENRLTDIAVLWRKSAQTLLPASLLVSLFLCVTAPWLIPLVFTAAYAGAVPVFQIWAFSILLEGFVGITPILRALSAFRYLLITAVLALVVRVGAGLLVLKTGSLPLQALTQLGISAAVLFANLTYIRYRLQVPWSTIAPVQNLRLSFFLGMGGVAATLLIAETVVLAPLFMLFITGALWSPIFVLVLRKQGVWGKVFNPTPRTRPADAKQERQMALTAKKGVSLSSGNNRT
jgi:O-antigen/teichoic acid export membrane protein